MTMTINMEAWGWPQWTYLGLLAFILLSNVVLDGTTKSLTKYSAGASLVSVLITLFILTSGGFFR